MEIISRSCNQAFATNLTIFFDILSHFARICNKARLDLYEHDRKSIHKHNVCLQNGKLPHEMYIGQFLVVCVVI